MATDEQNSTNDTYPLHLDCPEYGEFSEHYIQTLNFWIEGCVQTTLAVPGLIGNILFSILLTRKELRNSFNLLLVALAFWDSCYIVGAVLESIRISFNAASDLHLLLFPYLLYPGQNIAMTISIFLIVAIAFERYVAVHNPLDYKQAMNDSAAIRRRMLKYLLPVIIVSILFNVPKFFEATYFYVTEETDSGNVTTVRLNVTDLRINPTYSAYVNWSQSIVLGFLPAVMLMYFNTKIYLDIRERERRKRPMRSQWSNHQMLAEPSQASGAQARLKTLAPGMVSSSSSRHSRSKTSTSLCSESPPTISSPSDSPTQQPQPSSLKKPIQLRVELATLRSPSSEELPSCRRNASGGPNGSKSSNAKRRKAEDKMAMIFVAIVTGFLFTNFPRIFLNFHEVLILEEAMECSSRGQPSFPVWSRVLGIFSHLLLVLNSSINILFYCIFNAQFRTEAKKAFAQFCKVYCTKDNTFHQQEPQQQHVNGSSEKAANAALHCSSDETTKLIQSKPGSPPSVVIRVEKEFPMGTDNECKDSPQKVTKPPHSETAL